MVLPRTSRSQTAGLRPTPGTRRPTALRLGGLQYALSMAPVMSAFVGHAYRISMFHKWRERVNARRSWEQASFPRCEWRTQLASWYDRVPSPPRRSAEILSTCRMNILTIRQQTGFVPKRNPFGPRSVGCSAPRFLNESMIIGPRRSQAFPQPRPHSPGWWPFLLGCLEAFES